MPKFKVKKHVTLPTISMKDGDVKFIRFDEAIYVGKKVAAKPGEKEKEPPHLANVTNMEDGTLGTLIVNAVLKSTLDDQYPNNGYLAKTFRLEKLAKKAGKSYNGFNIAEVEVEPDAADAANSSAAPAPKPAATAARR